MLHYFTLDMPTKLQRKSSAPYNDLNATRFFCLLLMHINENIIYFFVPYITQIHCIANEHWHDHYEILEISRTAPTETSRNATNVEDICLPIPNILQTFSVHIRILMFKKARYHDAVYDTCYFILLWKIPHKWPKKDLYHDAVNHTCDTSLVKYLQTFATELGAIMCLMSKTECKSFCV